MPSGVYARQGAEERFWSKVCVEEPDNSDSCFLWCGGVTDRYVLDRENEYGKFWLDGQTVLAHRYAYTVTYGEIPEGEQVLHTCDKTLCVRPDHLFTGTQQDNMTDAQVKGRKGRSLTAELAAAMRADYAVLKPTYAQLAEKYNVSTRTVQDVILGVSWPKEALA